MVRGACSRESPLLRRDGAGQLELNADFGDARLIEWARFRPRQICGNHVENGVFLVRSDAGVDYAFCVTIVILQAGPQLVLADVDSIIRRR